VTYLPRCSSINERIDHKRQSHNSERTHCRGQQNAIHGETFKLADEEMNCPKKGGWPETEANAAANKNRQHLYVHRKMCIRPIDAVGFALYVRGLPNTRAQRRNMLAQLQIPARR
jgi:hypothetical protein